MRPPLSRSYLPFAALLTAFTLVAPAGSSAQIVVRPLLAADGEDFRTLGLEVSVGAESLLSGLELFGGYRGSLDEVGSLCPSCPVDRPLREGDWVTLDQEVNIFNLGARLRLGSRGPITTFSEFSLERLQDTRRVRLRFNPGGHLTMDSGERWENRASLGLGARLGLGTLEPEVAFRLPLNGEFGGERSLTVGFGIRLGGRPGG